ncbi:MAG: SRPBCC family protein [Pseudomonadota bacterium]
MDRDTELALIDELLALKQAKSPFLDRDVTHNPVSTYHCPDRFQTEQSRIFRKLPLIIAHTSEISAPGDFLRRDVGGLPLLLTCDQSGEAHAFLNVCRHRGTRLVEAEAGCKQRFTCPYHGWTYANTGDLIAAPHFEAGFAPMDKTDLGLKRLTCTERFGFVWVTADTEMADTENCADLETHLRDVATDLAALSMEDMTVCQQDSSVYTANWKLLVEGGIEAYHFKVAHRSTIAPYFEDNLSSYTQLGPHFRSILMRTSMATLASEPRDRWRLRDHGQLLYSLFPTTALLVQQDHIAWINQEPLGAAQTRVRLSTLVPKRETANTAHWQRNHEITRTTLAEDFALGESIQAGLTAGANRAMTFGRFEGALHAFNRTVETLLAKTP